VSDNGTLDLLATALASAVAAGLMVITGTVLVVDMLRTGGDSTLSLRFYILVAGTLAGLVLATGMAWGLLGVIGSTYRRGGLAIVCGFATVVLMLICVPINQVLGRTGLLVLLGLSAVSSGLFARRALSLRGRT
jgi:hypothetical protein